MASVRPFSQRPVSVDIAIVGGGIGGLAAAVALRRAGFDTHVFERARVLREVGGPLIVRQPSVQLIEAWSPGAFQQFAVRVDVVELLDIGGRLLKTSSMDFTGEGGTIYSVHRADLHDVLRDTLPSEFLHLGQAVSSVANTEDGAHAVLEFDDGSRVEAKLVVGADGIHSTARTIIARDEAVFQDSVVCRAIAPASALADGMTNDRARMWVDGARRLLTVPLRAGTLVAVDAIVDGEITGELEVGDLRPENQWNAEIPVESVLTRFAGFDPTVLKLIENRVTRVRADLIYDRPIIDSWSVGRIVLVGDAAHPMAPRQGQGANQALQDAGALADAVGAFGLDHPEQALARYHELRYATATALQTASRATPEQLGGRRADWTSSPVRPRHIRRPHFQEEPMATVSASDLDPLLDGLVERIVASYQNNDAEDYLRVFAPGATVWLSYLNGEMSAEQNAGLLSQIFTTFVGEFHYDNMRRHRTSGGYVQQCDLTIVAKSGATLTIPACQVATVNSDGLVERLEEYLDSAIMSFGQEQAELSKAF